ncbi:hypothetical protein [Clostridium sp. K04]|uniref:hypothetical protein n=1 Tax=Clostridium sp. K04 TaxID=2718929 RepID=UPI001C8BF2BE|nr:hypothetical protein [Clostridium sp. K04]MBX9184261.1 hypothetical protein [Clostridium sp. K04]
MQLISVALDIVIYHKNKVIKSIEEDFIKTLNKCKEITIKEYKDINVIFKICGRVLKLIAPLM